MVTKYAVDVNDVVDNTLDSDDLRILLKDIVKGEFEDPKYVFNALMTLLETAQQELEEREAEERRYGSF
jgi:hypothetical protein